MKILLLFNGQRHVTIRRVFLDLIFELQKFHTLYMYGFREQDVNDTTISPILFDTNLLLKDVVQELEVDLVILPNHARVRSSKIAGLNEKLSIPKVIIENDYYSVPIKTFYKEYNVDLIINQGADTININDTKVESVWLPFSVPNDAPVDRIGERIEKVVFVGGGRHSMNRLYVNRQWAIRILESSGLLDYYTKLRYYEQYRSLLTKYMVGLSDSFPPMFMTPLKTFEMMAYGLVVLSTPIHKEKVLFGDKQCFFEYNLDNIISVAEEVIKDKGRTQEIVNNALHVIKSKHLYSHRLEELNNIFDALIKGKAIPKKWGI